MPREKKKEVELGPEEEYEMVPLTPLRRLEKRLEAIEATRTTANLEKFIDKVIDMVELNQKIVDEVVKANAGLREDVAVLIGKMDELYSRLGDFVEIIKSAGEAEEAEAVSEKLIKETVTPLVGKIDEMSKKLQESNAAIADTLTAIEKRLRAVTAPAAPRPTLLARRPPARAPPAAPARAPAKAPA